MSRSTNIFTKENLLCRDRVGAMIFLLFCLCYGYQTTQIPIFPGDEYEPFTARTLPTILTYVGIGLALMLLVTGQPDKQSGAVMSFNWKLLIAFVVLMALYGLGLTYIGFVLATGFFLLAGFTFLANDVNRCCLAPHSRSLSRFTCCSLKVWISTLSLV